MAEEPSLTCPTCGGRLVQLDWNSRVDIMVCDKPTCPRYHQPGRTVGKGRQTTLAEDLAPLVRRGKSGRVKVIPPEEFLDDQEVSPALEDLSRLRRKLSAQKEEPEVLH